VTSRQGHIKVQVRLSAGVEPNTVWTWNAIGKRRGSWNLHPDAPESTRGFLVNHLIDDLLPEQRGGYRYSNSDPVTGQAAWYDSRVRVEKAAADEIGRIEPDFPTLKTPANLAVPPRVLGYGAGFKARS
jgi:sulfite dehydrogenase (quinone) subunit SoeA